MAAKRLRLLETQFPPFLKHHFIRRAAQAFPRIESDVVMIPARGNESSGPAVALCQLEAEHAAIKRQRALQVADLEMDVADPNIRVNGWSVWHFLVLTEQLRALTARH